MYTNREIVESLANASSAYGTNLITLYIPPYTSLSLISSKLTSELSNCQNIRDKSVKVNVQSALKSALQKIRASRDHIAPENGAVLCAGETTSCV